MDKNLVRIAIVGMGATGTTAAVFLLEELSKAPQEQQFEILCFEGKNEIGRGLAYSTSKDFHILNMPSETMSLFPDKPKDFHDWLRNEANYQLENLEYVPRHLFGRYLYERFRQAKDKVSSRIKVKLIFEDVIDCTEDTDAVTVRTQSSVFTCNDVVLCLGHVPKLQTILPFPGNNRYIRDPWDFSRYKDIEKTATVGILGSGLTAVDVVLTLTNVGLKGKIFSFARKRQLPKVKDFRKPVSLKHLTYDSLLTLSNNGTKPISIDALVDLMEKDFTEFPNGADLWQEFYWEPPRDSAKALAETLADSSSDKITWHTILDATSELIPFLWNQLSVEDRNMFKVRFEQKWHMFRHSMPRNNAKKIYEVIQREGLRIVTGELKLEFDTSKQQFCVTTKNPQKAEEPPEAIFVDYLIEARGATTDNLDQIDSVLLQNMRSNGQLNTAPLGGVDVDFNSSKIKFNNDKISARMTMVGELTRGVYFYTNSYEMNRNSARSIVENLTKKYTEAVQTC